MRVGGVLTRTDEGWWRLTPPAGLGPYLRHLFRLWTHRVRHLHAPMRGDHVTVAEPGAAPAPLEALLGRQFEFDVLLGEWGTNGNAVWVGVACDALEPFRATRSPLHLGVGYLTQERTRERDGRPDGSGPRPADPDGEAPAARHRTE